MYIRLFPKWNFPAELNVAVSGGVDSMVLLHFLMQSRKKVRVLHVNHGTTGADTYEQFVSEYCNAHGLQLDILYLTVPSTKPSSGYEHYWAAARRDWFSSQDHKVYLAHHLDDQIETYLMSTFHGTPRLMRHQNESNCYRPLLLNPKKNLYAYAKRHDLQFIEDPTNYCVDGSARNRIRNNVLPTIRENFKGINTVVLNKTLEAYHKDRSNVRDV